MPSARFNKKIPVDNSPSCCRAEIVYSVDVRALEDPSGRHVRFPSLSHFILFLSFPKVHIQSHHPSPREGLEVKRHPQRRQRLLDSLEAGGAFPLSRFRLAYPLRVRVHPF
jgi:hypothetical protein